MDIRKGSSRISASIAFPFADSQNQSPPSRAGVTFHDSPPRGRRDRTRQMAKIVEIRAEPLIYSIPLAQAVFSENCVTVSNSRPDRCGVCGSEAVLRLEPILN